MRDQVLDPLGPFSLDEICRRAGASLLDANDGSKMISDVPPTLRSVRMAPSRQVDIDAARAFL